MDDTVAVAIAEGQAALEAGDWAAARDAFTVALDDTHPEALEGYGLAIWFLGELEAGLEASQQACLAYGDRGDCDRAARLAVWISHQYVISGRTSLANGWFARAERALEGRSDCSGAGWVAVERARRGDVADCIQEARRALELGRAFGDADLEVFALTALGQAEIAGGRFDGGMLRLEEAMAAATAGRIRNPHTLGEAYCNIVAASANAGDWERAAEWCKLVDDFARDRSIVPLHGACRTVHAEVLVASGRWQDAETALGDALDAHSRHYPGGGAGAAAEAALALLRIRQGRLAEARALLAERGENPTSLLALAELRRAEGEAGVAVALLERGLANCGGDVLLSSRLLSSLVGAQLEANSNAQAREAAGTLVAIAEGSGRTLVRARAGLASARLELADGHPEPAHEHARIALELFSRMGMPHEAAESRIELARSLPAEQAALALEETRAAHTTFRDLGAVRSHDAAAALLRTLGAGSAPGQRLDGDLTDRERQVLALLAEGQTNAEIARTLFISEKTAGHHVGRILAKLGARNRTEAAAHAPRFAAAAE